MEIIETVPEDKCYNRSSMGRKIFSVDYLSDFESTDSSNQVFCSAEVSDSEDDDNNNSSSSSSSKKQCKNLLKKSKILIILVLWLICSCILTVTNVRVENFHQVSVPKMETAGKWKTFRNNVKRTIQGYLIMEPPKNDKILISLGGALLPLYYSNLSSNWMYVWVQLHVLKEMPKNRHTKLKKSNIILQQNVSDIWSVPLVSENLIGAVPEINHEKTLKLNSIKVDNESIHLLEIKFATNLKRNFPVSMAYNLQPINSNGLIYAGLILLGLYVMIIFDFLHKTLAAMLASTMSITVLAALNARPTMTEIVSWIDMDTLMLLFSMMTLVTIFGETGIFDYMSVIAYKLTGGKTWPLINVLCFITAFLSCFLDNVTTALLITPVTIKLCEFMKLNPVPVLRFMLIFANIGGAITPIGDPPNVIIASNANVKESGINFGVFTVHMGVGVFLVFIVVYLQLRITSRDVNYFKFSEPQTVQDLRHKICVWQRAAASLGSYSRDEENVRETLIKRSATLICLLKKANSNVKLIEEEKYKSNLKDLEMQYPIRNKTLLLKSGLTLFLVICMFFLHSLPTFSKLGLGWTALLGAVLLLILYDKEGIEGIFSRVEWSTLLFFASLFILMEALSRMGLIKWIGLQTQNIIMSVNQESRLAVAIVLILWVSGFASAFLDNLPLTTIMIKIASDMADNQELGLPLQPLIWALSFGACFGGNGSLFGSSSNIVCAGVAEQHGYRFAFLDFMRFGLPVMVSSLTVITIYLIICHVVFAWH